MIGVTDQTNSDLVFVVLVVALIVFVLLISRRL